MFSKLTLSKMRRLAGHSDVLMGVTILKDPKLAERLQFIQFGRRRLCFVAAVGFVVRICRDILFLHLCFPPFP